MKKWRVSDGCRRARSLAPASAAWMKQERAFSRGLGGLRELGVYLHPAIWGKFDTMIRFCLVDVAVFWLILVMFVFSFASRDPLFPSD